MLRLSPKSESVHFFTVRPPDTVCMLLTQLFDRGRELERCRQKRALTGRGTSNDIWTDDGDGDGSISAALWVFLPLNDLLEKAQNFLWHAAVHVLGNLFMSSASWDTKRKFARATHQKCLVIAGTKREKRLSKALWWIGALFLTLSQSPTYACWDLKLLQL